MHFIFKDPGIGSDPQIIPGAKRNSPNYSVYQDGVDRGVLVKSANGTEPLVGRVRYSYAFSSEGVVDFIATYYINQSLVTTLVKKMKTHNVCDNFFNSRALCIMIKQYTVISWLRGEQLNYCPEVVEMIWETVSRGRRPRATVSKIFSTTEGQWFDCFLSSLEITVLLPNCFKSQKNCQQNADTRRWRRDIWRFVTSFVMWPVNSALLTGQ